MRKRLSTGADVPGKQNINSISFWKCKIYMIFSSNFLSIWTPFCSRDAFCQLSSLQHSGMCLFTNTCSSKRESLWISCFLNRKLIFRRFKQLCPRTQRWELNWLMRQQSSH